MPITNNKIADLTPRWAPFRGFSILFDNPGGGLIESGQTQILACDPDDPRNAFYRGVRECADAIGADADSEMTLCLLPPPSYHVTVWDGGNDGKLDRIPADKSADLASFLDGLPGSVAAPAPILALPAASTLATDTWNLTFQLANIDIWANAVVAALEPVPNSDLTFDRFVEARTELGRRFEEVYAIKTYQPYTAHVTIGYFADQPGRDLAMSKLDDWKQIGHTNLDGITLNFETASIYGFTDMATFFRAVR